MRYVHHQCRSCCSSMLGALLCVLSVVPAAQARTHDEASEILQKAEWLERRGQITQAKELLQRAAKADPNLEDLALARAKVYLADKNPFWALRTLDDYIERRPPACAARALSARVHLQQGNLEQAAQTLDEPTCEASPEMRLRFSLLRVELAEFHGDERRVRQLILSSNEAKVRFSEDDRRYEALKAHYAPNLRPFMDFQLGVGTGWTSQGFASVPLDLAPNRGWDGSSLLALDLRTRFNLASFSWGRLLGNLDLSAIEYLDSHTRALSSRQPSLRLGTLLGNGAPRLYLGYAFDWVSLQGGSELGSEGLPHAQGHRLEYRLELGSDWTTYGSVGIRRFWESARNRFETMQGIAKAIALSSYATWDVAGTWHTHRATEHAYDQLGVTVDTGLSITLPRDFTLRERLLLTRSAYPHSESYFDDSERGWRRDTQVRASVSLTTPTVAGVRFELGYTLTQRSSNVDAYGYTDHRAGLTLLWSSDADRIRVRRIAPPGHVRMPYPDDEGQADGQVPASKPVDVIEIIRSDEAQRRGSSCSR